MKKMLWVCLAVILNIGCAKMLDGKLSYEYFDEFYYYEVDNGVLIAFRTFDSLLTVYKHELTSQPTSNGTNYQVVFLAKKMSEKEVLNQTVEFKYLSDGFIGYYVEIEGFNDSVDMLSYYDPISNKQHKLKKRTFFGGAETGGGSEESND